MFVHSFSSTFKIILNKISSFWNGNTWRKTAYSIPQPEEGVQLRNWQSLQCQGVLEVYVSCNQLLYSNVTSVVWCPAGTSLPFNITGCVPHESDLSPPLFIISVDTVATDLVIIPWTCFVDDTILILNI